LKKKTGVLGFHEKITKVEAHSERILATHGGKTQRATSLPAGLKLSEEQQKEIKRSGLSDNLRNLKQRTSETGRRL